ncbi:MAG: co-chaperone GroES [Fusobacteriaceae bacterium]
MILKPIGERIAVRLITEKKEEKTASGIILSTVKELDKPNLGEVIALGQGENMKEIEIGNKVFYSKFSGTEIKSENEKLILVNLKDVLAVIVE